MTHKIEHFPDMDSHIEYIWIRSHSIERNNPLPPFVLTMISDLYNSIKSSK